MAAKAAMAQRARRGERLGVMSCIASEVIMRFARGVHLAEITANDVVIVLRK
jgi:hypothetical protein